MTYFAGFRNAKHAQHCHYGLTDCRTASAVKKASYVAAVTSATSVLIRYGEMATIEVLPTATARFYLDVRDRKTKAAFPSPAWELAWFFERSRRQARAIRASAFTSPLSFCIVHRKDVTERRLAHTCQRHPKPLSNVR